MFGRCGLLGCARRQPIRGRLNGRRARLGRQFRLRRLTRPFASPGSGKGHAHGPSFRSGYEYGFGFRPGTRFGSGLGPGLGIWRRPARRDPRRRHGRGEGRGIEKERVFAEHPSVRERHLENQLQHRLVDGYRTRHADIGPRVLAHDVERQGHRQRCAVETHDRVVIRLGQFRSDGIELTLILGDQLHACIERLTEKRKDLSISQSQGMQGLARRQRKYTGEKPDSARERRDGHASPPERPRIRSMIWMALRAAPLRTLSATTHMSTPRGWLRSRRRRLTYTESLPAACVTAVAKPP